MFTVSIQMQTKIYIMSIFIMQLSMSAFPFPTYPEARDDLFLQEGDKVGRPPEHHTGRISEWRY